MNLHILNHTNYANRDVQWYATLGDYPEALDVIVNANFKELDGINTTQVVNTDAIGNYLLVTDGQNNILSRWFILDSTKQREHQYLLTLRRDVIADNYVQFTTSTAYITKGYVDDVDSPLMFNDEGVKLNEIKQQEILLRDKFGGNAWYVIYLNPKMLNVRGRVFSGDAKMKSSFNWAEAGEVIVPVGQSIEFFSDQVYVKISGTAVVKTSFQNHAQTDRWWKIGDFASNATIEITGPGEVIEFGINPRGDDSVSASSDDFMLIFTAPTGGIRWDDGSVLPYEILTMPVQSSKYRYKQGEYVDWGAIHGTERDNLMVATTLAKQYSGSNMVYDIQIIPYCPIASSYVAGTSYDLNSMITVSVGYQTTLDPTFAFKQQVTVMAPVTNYRYEGELDGPGYVPPEDPIDFKLSTTRKYRLNSGNYASSYDFSPAMNHGIESFKYSVMLQPYKPYVYVAPVYNSNTLYGRDFNDARGLICGGDYSIAQSSNEWFNYILTNKNNEAAFDRQVQSLLPHGEDVGRSVLTAAAAGALSGGVPGAIIGATSSAIGSIAGAQHRIEDTRAAHDLDMRAIQARGETIKNVSAWTPNAKFWPFIEVYDCTTAEKQALRKKLETDGMTINTIDQPQMFMKNDGKSFIQGELIRCNVIEPHMFNEIASEFAKGVRM